MGDLTARQIVLAGTLPVPPSTNKLWEPFTNKQGQADMRRTREAVAYEEVVQQYLAYQDAEPHRVWAEPLLLRKVREDRRLELECIFWFFFQRSGRDLDNGIKVLQDAVYRWLEVDDRRVIEGHQYKRIDRQNPHVALIIRLVPPPHPESDRQLRAEQLASFPAGETLPPRDPLGIARVPSEHTRRVRQSMLREFSEQPTVKTAILA